MHKVPPNDSCRILGLFCVRGSKQRYYLKSIFEKFTS